MWHREIESHNWGFATKTLSPCCFICCLPRPGCCTVSLNLSDLIRHQLDHSNDTHLDREISEAINHSKFSCRQIQYGTEKYLIYQELCEACTYVLPPTSPIFITETNCLFSLFRSCDTAAVDFRGTNKCAVLLATFYSNDSISHL